MSTKTEVNFEMKNSLYTSVSHHLSELDPPLRILRRVHDNRIVCPDMHFHDFEEIAVVVGGEAAHRVSASDGSFYNYRVSRGSAFVINIGEEHEFIPNDGETVEIINIIYDPQIISRTKSGLEENSGSSDFLCLLPQIKPSFRFDGSCKINDSDMPKFEALAKIFESEQEAERSGSSEICVSLFCAMGALIYRMYEEKFDETLFNGTRIKTNSVLLTLKYISDNFDKDISLAELSRLAMCSERHLARKFKQVTGRTVTEYIRRQRISNACRMLKNTDLQVHEIAEAVGFNDCSFFIRTFRKLTSRTPSEYRKASLHSE